MLKSRAKRHAELKQQIANRHPGIKEVMEVYIQWEEAHKAEQAYRVAQHSGYITFNSNSSNPKFFFQEK